MLSYTAQTTNASNKVTAVPEEKTATMVITVGATEIDNGAQATWADGANALKVAVTAGKSKKTYTVTVTKA